jgi:tetratricopeptide (TPR) repeat protein
VAAEPAAADEVITRCAGLPLALVIVAARAVTHPGLPLAALAEQLCHAQGLDALVGDDVVTDVRAVFSWSYRAVSPPAARLFRLLGLHPGPEIGVAAAASLAGIAWPEAHGLLGELARGHLVTEPTAGRYAFHDLLRAYAAELARTVDTDADRRAAMHRMLDHYVHTGCPAAMLLEPHRPPLVLASSVDGVEPEVIDDHGQALVWFTTEHPVLLALLDPAAAGGFDVHIGQLAWTLTDFLQRRGHWHDQATVYRAALAAAARSGDLPALARAHRQLGRAYTLLGDYENARTNYRRALALSAEIGDILGQAHTHLNLSHISEGQGNYPEALEHCQRALELAEQTGDRVMVARCLNAVGWYSALTGDLQPALDHCQRALALTRELGDRNGEANTLDSIGQAYHLLGDYERAIACFREAIEVFEEFGDRYPTAEALVQLGEAHKASGNAPAARDSWRRALEVFEELDHPDAAGVRAKLRDLDRLDDFE